MYGHNVSHSKRRTRRIFKPNLHTSRVEVNGVMKRMKLCTKCMRMLKGKSTRDKKLNVVKEVAAEVPAFPTAPAV